MFKQTLPYRYCGNSRISKKLCQTKDIYLRYARKKISVNFHIFSKVTSILSQRIQKIIQIGR